ncbi:unnamed protein product [Photorhabdus laumondii subsp. laumondii TTO1]|uniref:Photorhabdus luminescens subsp. laumondii TTO1 complete genome segment 4/17 n=1 Tax=Photorhabdus laumondii subsp. laumondii (strain DSM 15139 / CIP 105565 / TT01) TaxID=243265 RepID=Q7N7R8_PHOLL|nr:unnamed protein product [Photorhabdus laumondii subsp. laumondii TTO1]
MLYMHPILNTPDPCHDFIWLLIRHDSLIFAPVLQTRRNHPTPHFPSITVWLKFTKLVQVHLLHTCVLPLSRSRDTFIQRCSRASVTLPYVRHSHTIKHTNYCGKTFACKILLLFTQL